VLYPIGDASPLPNPVNPTSTTGTHPYSANSGDAFTGLDYSTNLNWMLNEQFYLGWNLFTVNQVFLILQEKED
jgi:hypothetical protein